MRILAIFVIIICGSSLLWASPLPEQGVENYLYNFQLKAAERTADQLQEEGKRQFYLAHVLMYHFFATQDPLFAEKIRENWKDYTQAIETLSDREKGILFSELYGKRAIVEFLSGNYLLASRLARVSYKRVKAHEEAYPGDAQSLKMSGLFNVVLGNVPRRYQWLANAFGYTGDLRGGLTQLEEAGRHSRLLRHEAVLILSTIEKSMLDKPLKGLERLQKEGRRHKNNPLIDYFSASSLLKLKRNQEALDILLQGNRYDTAKVQYIPFWHFLQGKAYYFKNDYTQAQRSLALFVRGYKGSLMRTDAYFRLGMSLTLNQRYELGKPFFELIAKGKHGGFDEDEYAYFMAKKFAEKEPDGVTQALFRARNYFDGGYYSKAVAILRQLTFIIPKTSAAQTELNYRYARIYHSMGKLETAKNYYKASVESPGGEDETYLKAYASYFMGEIAREQGQKVLAVSQYEEALKYEDYFYQLGLENRCKAALSGLK